TPSQVARLRRTTTALLVCAAVGSVAVWLMRSPTPQPRTPATAKPNSADAEPPAQVTRPTPLSAPRPKITPRAPLSDTPPPEDDYLEQLAELNRTDKQAALTLAEKGEQWYAATGKRAEARRAMRITLLADLNRMHEARALTR